MSETVETAPHAVLRDRSVEARRAARQAKARREKRIIDCLNRGVSIVEIAEREDLGEKRIRALVREILARRMPEPPAQFIALQVSRLSEALDVSFGAMSGANLQAVDRVVRIVRELDRYHGFVAAERRGLPAASEAPNESDQKVMALLVERVRSQVTPPRLEKIEFAQESAMASEAPDSRGMVQHCDSAFASALDPSGETAHPVEAPAANPEMAPQSFEKIESAPGIGMAPDGPGPQDMAPARCEPLVIPAAANPSGARRVNVRMTLNGIEAYQG